MLTRFRLALPAALLAAALSLSACRSSEEKAEDYYQSALQLMDQGDVDGAMVELRNVFQYNGFHKDARKLYADTLLERGEVAEAYSQYLRLIEQYPDTVEVRQTLAEIAMTSSDWTEFDRHSQEAIRLAPEDPRSRALAAARDYRQASLNNDAAGKAKAAAVARAVQQELPDNVVVRRVVIDDLINGPDADPVAAMAQIDAGLIVEPKAMVLHGMKLQLLARQGDTAGTIAHLKDMVALFPDNTEVRAALINLYMSQKDFAGAEAFLRQLAGDDTAAPEGHAAVVQLLQLAQGSDAAMAELDRLIAANQGQPNAQIYTALRAAIVFDGGDREGAIATVETVLQSAEPSDQTRRIKIMLAQMLQQTGNVVGARARVEEVLAEDATNADALRMRAAWLIQEDKPGDAIIDLRAALSQDPTDVATLTLLAEAYLRDGNADLAGEQMAAAVDASQTGAEESLRYAAFLQQQGRSPAAEKVLNDARKANPGNVAVLQQLANMKLLAKDFTGANEVLTALEGLNSPEAKAAANELEAAILMGQNRTEESLSFLQGQVDQAGDGDRRALVMLLRTQMGNGQAAKARATLDAAIAKTPDDVQLQLISASLYAASGDTAKAEEVLRGLIAADAKAEAPVRLLYSLYIGGGQPEEAAKLLDAALVAQPDSMGLAFLKAGALERSGDIDGAIAIYETLYAKDSSNIVLANNLASMIATYHDDPAGLERAFAIARRLNGTDVPAFQDTYGWIQFRRGNLDEALGYLEPAAKGLPDDPMVQVHLGLTYAGLNRNDEARATLTQALTLAGDSTLPQFQTARDALAKLPPAP